MKHYGQYCPVSRAAEVIAERWTLLVIRELLWGSDRFNAIARGVPRMSPSLLSTRLRELERSGIVVRELLDGEPRYRLTEAGLELQPLVELAGAWGQRWMQELREDEYDPAVLMLDIAREVALRTDDLPPRPTTVQLDLTGVPRRYQRWWWIFGSTGLDVCDTDPGSDATVWIQTDAPTLTQVWIGHRPWSTALRSEDLRVTGDAESCAALPGWLGASRFADVALAATPLPRLTPGG
ncbi:MAG TPA: helix-turn-helix domain-containing protein [Marmoricola sp.]|jgi:DNA-binding HxlR family transcriptional regulator|nr:helix-turn-helix domain-containing protein [Marmoricola sp.]